MKQLRNTQKLSEESEEGELDEITLNPVKIYKNLRKRSSRVSANFYGGDPKRSWNGWEAWKKSKEQPKKTN